MGKKFTILLLTLLLVAGFGTGYVATGLQAYARYQQNTVANQEHCGGQLPIHICVRTPAAIFSAFYPSYVVNQYPLFKVEYSSDTPVTLVISVSIVGFSQTVTQTVNADAAMQSVSFTPPMQNAVFHTLTAEDNTSLHVQVTDMNMHLYYLNDSPLRLHSRWLMQWLATNRLKIAAWITPDAAAIADLVRKAQAHLTLEPGATTKAMSGYINTNRQGVIAQVNAIYDTLVSDYHMHYVQESIPYTGTGDNNEATEYIKLPAEVLQQRSGMCIELTLLLASAVEHIGIHTEIVIIPGHAFLGVAVTPDEQHFEYWDAVQVNNNVAGDSANTATDTAYTENMKAHTILDTIMTSDARKASIDAMM